MLLVAVALLAVVAADADVAAAVLQFVADAADAFNRTWLSGHRYPLFFVLEAAASHRNSRSARKLAMAMGIWHLASLVSNHITWCADHLRMRHK